MASVPPMDWKTRSTGAPQAHGFHLSGDVGKHAALGGDMEALAGAVDQVEQLDHGAQAVGDGVDADDGVARAEHQAVDDGGGDTRGDRRWDGWAAGGWRGGRAGLRWCGSG